MTENRTQMTAAGQDNDNYWFYRVSSSQMYVWQMQCSVNLLLTLKFTSTAKQ